MFYGMTIGRCDSCGSGVLVMLRVYEFIEFVDMQQSVTEIKAKFLDNHTKQELRYKCHVIKWTTLDLMTR